MITEQPKLQISDKQNLRAKRKFGYVIIALILIVAGLAGWYFFSLKSNKNIKTITVKKQEIKEILDISGSVSSEHDINLKAVSSGLVVKRFINDNTRVKSGTPILEIDPQQLRLQLNQARINVLANQLQAETALVNARKTLTEAKARQKINIENLNNQIDKAEGNVKFLEGELKRNESLLEQGAITHQSVDNQKQQLKQAGIDLKTARDNLEKVKRDKAEIVTAQNTLDQAGTMLGNTINQGEATLSIARDSLQRTTVNAPFNGTISLWQINEGDFVVTGTPLGKFQDLDDIRLVLPVNELDLPKIKTSNKVEIIFDAYPEKKYSGKVVWIGQSTIADVQNVQNFPVKVRFDNPGHLIKPGMSGDAQITVSSRKNILAVPLTAIHKKESKIFINILAEKTIKEIEIKPGLATLDFLEVKSGLKGGEQLITEEVK
jgi:HlyD family secretion protein